MIYEAKMLLVNQKLDIDISSIIGNDLVTQNDTVLISKFFNENMGLATALQEHNYIIGFGPRMSCYIFLVSVGNETSCYNYSKEIVEFLVLSRAKGFMMIHNHPGRDAIEPSGEDYESFGMFHMISELLDIPFCDYIIVGNGNYYSARENNEIDKSFE